MCVSESKLELRGSSSGYSGMSQIYSSYFYQLEEVTKQCYIEKLDKLGGINDPYSAEPTTVCEDWQNWPDVEYADIYNYLIETPSVYTCNSLKAYKNLKAYNYYVNGWIDDVRVVQITKLCHPHYMVTASVRHSQKLSVAPVKENGIVVCTHCSCMVGLGEACSHIAALLFTLEGNTKMKRNITCSSLPCLDLNRLLSG